MEKENLVRIINKYFKNKTLNYKGPIIHGVEMEGDIDFNVEVLGTRKMISVGEYYDFFILKITIVGLNNDLSKLVFGGIPHLVDLSKIINENNFWYFKTQLISYLSSIIRFFDSDYVRLTIDEFNVDVKSKEPITESRMSRIAIRTIVKDIVELIKKNVRRKEYTLPSDQDFYSFTNLPFEFGVELTLIPSKKIEGFDTTAYYVTDEDIVELVIKYNPNNILKNLYELIGELNEILAHEIEHGYQEYYGEFDSNEDFEKIKDPFTYYTLPHEIPAQVQGFNRLSKLKRQPFDVVAKNWFDTHKDVHGLNQTQVNKVLEILLKYYNDKRGNK